MNEIRADAGSETRRDISTNVVTGGWMVVEDRREQVFEGKEVGQGPLSRLVLKVVVVPTGFEPVSEP